MWFDLLVPRKGGRFLRFLDVMGFFGVMYLDPPRGAKWIAKGAMKQPLTV